MTKGFLAYIILALFVVPFEASAQKREVVEVPSSEFAEGFYQDVRSLQTYLDNMEKTMDVMRKDQVVFDRERTEDFDLEERERLYTFWINYLDHLVAFDQLTGEYKDFYRLKADEQRARAFLLAYSAYVAKFSYGLQFIRTTIGNELYETKLDDRNPEYGIPGGLYAKLKWNTIHVQDVSNIMAGYQYHKFLKKKYAEEGLSDDPRTSWLFDYIDREYKYVTQELKVKGPRYFVANGLDIVKEKAFLAWFPVQMNVSVWMGDTRVKRLHQSLITVEQLKEMQQSLKPGDIIVTKRNWYLSNVGLPGFWPHAELYIGTSDDLMEFFRDPSVVSYYQSKGTSRDFMDYLKKRYPEKIAAFLRLAPDGHHYRIIEAVGEGVKFSSLPEGTLADYVGVMRPKLSKLDIARAIDEAFSYLGRPYDFNFDFLTDSTIVCSELIYKIYQHGDDKKGLDLKVREIAGRKAMPANDIVKKFDREYDTPEQELGFVYFLDGNEKDQKAVVKGLADFRSSHKRLKYLLTKRHLISLVEWLSVCASKEELKRQHVSFAGRYNQSLENSTITKILVWPCWN